MTQYSALMLFAYLILLVILTCLLIPKMQLQNLRPVFTIPFKNTLLSAHTVTMLPYTEIFAFLMMAGQFIKPEASGKALRRGLLIGAAVILFLVVRDTAVLGGYVLYVQDPTFNTIRLIDVGDILTRLEIINAVLLITLLFFKVSILLYAVTAGVGQIFNIRESKVFSLIIGVLTVICANVFFVSSSEHQMWSKAAATYATFFLFVLPLLTLIVSMFRKPAADGPEENLRRQ
jgi:spore germination protein KB